MTVSFLGSGNVATHMALAFKRSGFDIGQIWSLHYENAIKLAGAVNSIAVENLNALLPADLYIISVKDDAINSILSSIIVGDALIVHTSGATSISIFEGYAANFGVLYPLQTFSEERNVDFSAVPLCIEANNEESAKLLTSIAGKLNKKSYQVDSQARQTLHLAAVFACNFTNHLYAISKQLLEEKGLDFEILRPLIKETADKITEFTPEEVQTGPAFRGDIVTMEQHLQLLSTHPHLHEIYRLLSAHIINLKG